MLLTDVLTPEVIEPNLKATDKVSVLKELVELLVKHNLIEDKEVAVDLLLKREQLVTTGIGHGIAIPHARSENIKRIVAAFGRSVKGVEFEAMDNEPVHLIFLLLAPCDKAATALKLLARMSRLLKRDYIKKQLLSLEGRNEILRTIKEAEERLL